MCVKQLPIEVAFTRALKASHFSLGVVDVVIGVVEGRMVVSGSMVVAVGVGVDKVLVMTVVVWNGVLVITAPNVTIITFQHYFLQGNSDSYFSSNHVLP